MIFSYVQEKILTKFLKNKKLRYSEAVPNDERISDDLYNYHLQFLVKKGFLKKEKKFYQLTNQGKKSVQFFDSRGDLKDLFKVSVLCYLVENSKILLQKRIRHPYQGDIGVISGKVNLGEKIEDAASRKLEEETGLRAKFNLVGVFRSTRKHKKNIVEDTFYHVCFSDNFVGQLVKKSEFGENFWGTFNQVIKLQRKNISASSYHEKIYKRLQKKDFSQFYFQEEIELEAY